MADKSEDMEILKSDLIPKHEILSGDEKSKVFEQFNINPKQLPRIKEDDPVVKLLGAKKGDVIRIVRKEEVTGEYVYYRVVV